jgi:hypothetical protein
MRKTPGVALRCLAAAGLLTAAGGCALVGTERTDSTDPVVRPAPVSWEEQAADIDGVTNYREERPDLLGRDHLTGPLEYEVLPPVGGPHNSAWLNCQGDVYPEQVPNEHAVHSLEHGAVWITYRPDLPADQVDALASRVRGNSHLFLSPFPGLDAPISLQAWGFQLKVDDAADSRIDEFIRVLRINASPEGPNAPCGGGVSVTGTTPIG